MKSFTAPTQSSIDLGVYQMLIDFGWPPNLLHTLFIERATVNGIDALRKRSTKNWGRYEVFRNWLAEQPDLRVCARPDPTDLGLTLTIANNTDLEDIVAVANAKLRLRAVNNRWQVSRPGSEYLLASDCNALSDAVMVPQTTEIDPEGAQRHGRNAGIRTRRRGSNLVNNAVDAYGCRERRAHPLDSGCALLSWRSGS